MTRAKLTYTANKIHGFELAKGQVIQHHDLTPEEWTDIMLDTGRRFVDHFSQCFQHPELIHSLLIQNANFWRWWRYKWIVDDAAYVKSIAYYSDVTYHEIKDCMITDEVLKWQLINLIDNKTL